MIIRNSKELGHLVRNTRQQRALTQAQLAAHVGVSRKWIIDLEAGKRTTDLSLVFRTLNSLGLNLDAKERTKRKSGGFDINAIIDAAKKGRHE